MAQLDLWSEEWRLVPGFEWGYYVSNFGRVRGPRKMLKLRDNGKGYLAVALYKRKSCKRHCYLVSRLVALAFMPVTESSELHVHHKDGNPLNNQLENLEWVESARHSKSGVKKGWDGGTEELDDLEGR